MIHDALIDTIMDRAEEYLDNDDYVNAVKCHERALRRIFNTMQEEGMKSAKEYEEKFETNYILTNIVIDYLVYLDDCFRDTGDKTYLEKILEFKEKRIKYFEEYEYTYLEIIRCNLDAMFYLGKSDKAINEYNELIKKYPTNDINYFRLAMLYYDNKEIEKGIKVLKQGIEKCSEGKAELYNRLNWFQEELMDIKKGNKKK